MHLFSYDVSGAVLDVVHLFSYDISGAVLDVAAPGAAGGLPEVRLEGDGLCHQDGGGQAGLTSDSANCFPILQFFSSVSDPGPFVRIRIGKKSGSGSMKKRPKIFSKSKFFLYLTLNTVFFW